MDPEGNRIELREPETETAFCPNFFIPRVALTS
jgi:hypothetical protein